MERYAIQKLDGIDWQTQKLTDNREPLRPGMRMLDLENKEIIPYQPPLRKGRAQWYPAIIPSIV